MVLWALALWGLPATGLSASPSGHEHPHRPAGQDPQGGIILENLAERAKTDLPNETAIDDFSIQHVSDTKLKGHVSDEKLKEQFRRSSASSQGLPARLAAGSSDQACRRASRPRSALRADGCEGRGPKDPRWCRDNPGRGRTIHRSWLSELPDTITHVRTNAQIIVHACAHEVSR